jgi:hypothetical protein
MSAFSYDPATGTATIKPDGPVTISRKPIELQGSIRMEGNMTTATTDSGMLARLQELATAEPFEPFIIEMPHDRFTIRKRSDIGFTNSGSPKVHTDHTWSILNEDHITKCYLEPMMDQISERMERMEMVIHKAFKKARAMFTIAAFVQAVIILSGICFARERSFEELRFAESAAEE